MYFLKEQKIVLYFDINNLNLIYLELWKKQKKNINRSQIHKWINESSNTV